MSRLVVNQEVIESVLIDEAFQRIKAQAEQNLRVSCCEMDDQFYQQAEEEVVDGILIAQEADRRFSTFPEEVLKERLQETMQSYRDHGATWEFLESQMEMLREECIANLRMESLTEEVSREAKVWTEEDIRSYYESHLDDYRQTSETHALHLMKEIRNHESPEGLYREMVLLRKRFLQGESFEETAPNETEHPDGEFDLGWLPLTEANSVVESILFSLEEGEVGPVFFHDAAFHLFKVIGKEAGELADFDEIKDEIKDRMETERQLNALKFLAKELRQKATIERKGKS